MADPRARLRPAPDPEPGMNSWPAFRARAHADCARHNATPPTDEQLADEYIRRRGDRARLAAWMEVHQP